MSSNESLCSNCGKKGKDLWICGNCRQAHYCDDRCQAGHWAWHKQHCKKICSNRCKRGTDLKKWEVLHRKRGLKSGIDVEVFRGEVKATKSCLKKGSKLSKKSVRWSWKAISRQEIQMSRLCRFLKEGETVRDALERLRNKVDAFSAADVSGKGSLAKDKAISDYKTLYNISMGLANSGARYVHRTPRHFLEHLSLRGCDVREILQRRDMKGNFIDFPRDDSKSRDYDRKPSVSSHLNGKRMECELNGSTLSHCEMKPGSTSGERSSRAFGAFPSRLEDKAKMVVEDNGIDRKSTDRVFLRARRNPRLSRGHERMICEVKTPINSSGIFPISSCRMDFKKLHASYSMPGEKRKGYPERCYTVPSSVGLRMRSTRRKF
mmetsp:Transcript_10703/g.15957  ORF Transcript_10703/g.15957 Transcript_10703/m.15957 type:complete len:377 (+) Transcript_10703:131-1261(+)